MGSLSLIEASMNNVSVKRQGCQHLVLTSSLDNRRDNLVVPGPDELARCIHRHSRLLTTKLDNNSTIIETNSNTLLALLIRNTPSSLQTVVERLLESVGVGVPYSYRTVLGTGNNDWQFGMVASKGNVVGVSFKGGDQGLCGVIPNLDGSVVGSGEEVGLVRVRVVVDMVDTLCLVSLEGEVGSRRSKTPDLDSSVKTS